MKILAPFSLRFDFGCHFGCHQNAASPDQIYCAMIPLAQLREGLEIRALLLQTGRNSRDSLRSTNASVRSH